MKMTFEELLEIQPYSLNKEQKKRILTQRLVELTQLHREHCSEYAQILDSISFDENKRIMRKFHSYRLGFLKNYH